MAGNTFGKLFRITTYGESHGKAIGVVIDGCPAGLEIDEEQLAAELRRRRPGQSELVTPRDEKDKPEIISGIYEGKTLGSPIHIMIHNGDKRSQDYGHLKNILRPSHADYTYQAKYGIRDPRGGGRSSARETAARVAAGAIAKQLLKHNGIDIRAGVTQIGKVASKKGIDQLDFSIVENNLVRGADPALINQMVDEIKKAKEKGDTVGGVITTLITGAPAGLGEPVFDKLHAELGKAMLSINAVKGFEIGSGFRGATMNGTEHNDIWENINGKLRTKTNHSGGIQGGISNGMPIYFNTAFKPVSTIMRQQESIDTEGNKISYEANGRHDPCVLPRAVPIVEAMAALVIADFLLLHRTTRL